MTITTKDMTTQTKPSPTDSAQTHPVKPGERLVFVDVLRGFAVLGILIANMYSYSGVSYNPTAWGETLDRYIVAATRFLVEAKFYSLFSFLFGWGMAIQLIRAEARGARFLPVYFRRTLILLGIGLVHAVLIWEGDILFDYAMFGFLLLLFRKRSPRFLLVTAGLVLGFSILMRAPWEFMNTFREWYLEVTDFLIQPRLPDSVLASGTYWQAVRYRWLDHISNLQFIIFYFGNVFGMFLLGLYAGKRRIFEDLAAHRRLLRTVMWVGLGVGLVFNGLLVRTYLDSTWVAPENVRFTITGTRTVGAPALMLFYVTALIRLYHHPRFHGYLAPLANVGRMALTNYLTHSVVLTLFFYGYGLGLYGSTDPAFGLIPAGLLFLLQIRFSRWWFEHYQYGPVEWLWRTLTYGQRPPLRHGEVALSPPTTPLGRKKFRRLAGVNPVVILSVTWIGLLIWGVLLWSWRGRLKTLACLRTGDRDPRCREQSFSQSPGFTGAGRAFPNHGPGPLPGRAGRGSPGR